MEYETKPLNVFIRFLSTNRFQSSKLEQFGILILLRRPDKRLDGFMVFIFRRFPTNVMQWCIVGLASFHIIIMFAYSQATVIAVR